MLQWVLLVIIFAMFWYIFSIYVWIRCTLGGLARRPLYFWAPYADYLIMALSPAPKNTWRTQILIEISTTFPESVAEFLNHTRPQRRCQKCKLSMYMYQRWGVFFADFLLTSWLLWSLAKKWLSWRLLVVQWQVTQKKTRVKKQTQSY